MNAIIRDIVDNQLNGLSLRSLSEVFYHALPGMVLSVNARAGTALVDPVIV